MEFIIFRFLILIFSDIWQSDFKSIFLVDFVSFSFWHRWLTFLNTYYINLILNKA
jgi:hypothetical protein